MSYLTLLNGRLLDSADLVDIEILGDRITGIRPAGVSEPKDGQTRDVQDILLVPGFIDGHHHSHENYLKGRFEGQPLELVMNFVRPLKPIIYTPRQVYIRTMISALEALKSGATTIVDDMNVSPHLNPEHVEAAFQAYEDCGIRALLGITLFDRPFFRAIPFVDEEFPADLLAELSGVRSTPPTEILAFAGSLARDRHPAQKRVGYIVAPSAPQRCTDDFLQSTRRLADDYDLPMMIHAQETRLQAVMGPMTYGCSMIEHLSRTGFLKPRTKLIHAVWLTPRDIDLIAESGASVQHNPTVNMKLGSGLMPMRELLDAGVNVSLGTDGCGLVETANMLRAVSNTAYVQKLRGGDPDRWIGAPEAFEAATVGGARALGMDKYLGRIAIGMKADICGYDLKGVAFTPLNNALRQLVYAETGASLAISVIDGRVVIDDGRVVMIDEGKIWDEARDIHATLKDTIDDVEKSVRPLIEPYRRIYARCACHPLQDNTFPARFSAEPVATSS